MMFWQKLCCFPCVSGPFICLFCLMEMSKTFCKYTVTIINSVSGFPAESPGSLEPSSQFDESLHSPGQSHDMSHSELKRIPKPLNYWINFKQNISLLQQKMVKNKPFKCPLWLISEATTTTKNVFSVTSDYLKWNMFGKGFPVAKLTTENTEFNNKTWDLCLTIKPPCLLLEMKQNQHEAWQEFQQGPRHDGLDAPTVLEDPGLGLCREQRRRSHRVVEDWISGCDLLFWPHSCPLIGRRKLSLITWSLSTRWTGPNWQRSQCFGGNEK